MARQLPRLKTMLAMRKPQRAFPWSGCSMKRLTTEQCDCPGSEVMGQRPPGWSNLVLAHVAG